MKIIDSYKFAIAGGGGGLTLDNDTTNLVAAWSISRRLLTAYTGNLVRIRDSTTTTEGNIGYDGSNLFDTTARDALISTHDATLVKIYDQSGNGFDAAEATSSNQPYIKTGGTVQTLNGNQGATFVKANTGRMNTSSVNHGIGTSNFCLSAIVKTDSSFDTWEPVFGIGSVTPGIMISRAGVPGFYWGADYSFSALSTSTTYVLTYIRQAGEYKMYINGTLESNHPAIYFSDCGTTTTLTIMGYATTGGIGGGTILEFILWKGIPTNLSTILADQKTHAGL